MRTDRRGRPRLVASRRPGQSPASEILDAAAELFTTLGYSATSTRRIADAVGIKQASLYHHFDTKADILDALLADTVDGPLRLAAELLSESGSSAPHLHTLVVADAGQLCSQKWNLGALYLLPDLRAERFATFRQRRNELRAGYRQLARAVITEYGGTPDSEDLPYRLVESVINRRSDDGDCPPGYPWTIAEGALRLLGYADDMEQLRSATADRLRLHAPLD